MSREYEEGETDYEEGSEEEYSDYDELINQVVDGYKSVTGTGKHKKNKKNKLRKKKKESNIVRPKNRLFGAFEDKGDETLEKVSYLDASVGELDFGRSDKENKNK